MPSQPQTMPGQPFNWNNVLSPNGLAPATGPGGLVGPYTAAFPNQPSPPTFTPVSPGQSLGAEASNLLSMDNLNPSGLNDFQNQAMSQGPTQWAQQAMQQQNLLAQQAKSAGAATVAGQGAASRAALASRGGLSSGAAERVAQGGANNYLSMTQGVNAQQAQNLMQVGMNDQQNKLSMLAQIPGMQLGAANFGLQKTGAQLGATSTDISNQMMGAQAANQWGMQNYATQMAGYGAGQTAQATANQKK